ncbi:Flp family type IVb pilin [Pleionea litopenaei]|uniref:Pilus assembly protein n=1 Tax=Pleionea litopenaei TaxID=3070815 RepID=A0AA51RTE1_9GAMM|nr:pilus assembly protein [Pleionea sp. HL-JVS1]WMS87242.1 pilus assembly protein [Pleionea sp. HL-JVS1]
MKNVMAKKRSLGQGMTEYIIIVALIAVAAIGVFSMFGKTISSQAAGLAQEMSGSKSDTALGDAKNSAKEAQNIADQTNGLSTYKDRASGKTGGQDNN